MRILTTITLGVLLSALVAREAAAQWNVARFDGARNRVYASYGLDPALVSTAGYGRVLSVAGHPFELTGDVGVVTAKLDAHDFRVGLGARSSLLQWRAVRLVGSATSITRGTDNSIYRAVNFGADVTGALGVYRPRWFAAGELGFDKAIATHVAATDWYRTTFYPGAKSGWYTATGGIYHYGLTSGLSLGSAEVAGRFGWRRSERFEDVMPPLYATVGIGVGF